MRDSQIADLVTMTLEKMGRGRFEQIAQHLNQYEVMSWLLNKNGMFGGVEELTGGKSIKEQLMTKQGGTFRWVGLYEKDEANVTDFMTDMEVNWAHGTDNMSYERRELLENTGEARINNIMVPRRTAMMLRVAEALEDAFFNDPVSTTQKIPWGLPYWIVKNVAQGFNGAAHSAVGGTTVAGVNTTTYPTFKNYTDSYAAISKEDLVRKLRRAHFYTKWKSPTSAKEFRSETGMQRRIFTNYATLAQMEEIGEAQNENLGRDLAPYDGEMTFRRHAVRAIAKLDDDTTNPIYMMDLGTFKLFVLKGDYLRETDAKIAPLQHNVFTVHVDLTYQTLCINRRANAVLYQA